MRRLAIVLASALSLQALPCRAQGSGDLAAARLLFAEAVADEDARRYEPALDKFRRVAAVKETANVRYRIASCLDALGRRAEAVAAYDAVVRVGAQEAGAADAVRASRERATQLEPSIARLEVTLPSGAPSDAQVFIDDAPVDARALGGSLPLEPGRHTLRATATGRTPFETAVQLGAGGRVAIAVTLPTSAATLGGAPSTNPPGPGAAADTSATPSTPIPAGAWIAGGIGGALAVGAVVSLVLRSNNLSTLNHDCTTTPSGSLSCPPSSRNEVSSAHDAAALEGPLGIGLAAGAVVAFGVGALLLWTAPSRASSGLVVTPTIGPAVAGLVVSGSL
jgi:hypothetical protein